jgi:membrane fusion protein (multidrug efflux system)
MSESESESDHDQKPAADDPEKSAEGGKSPDKSGDKKLVYKKPISLTISVQSGAGEKEGNQGADEKSDDADRDETKDDAGEKDDKEEKADESKNPISVTISIKGGEGAEEKGGDKEGDDKKGKDGKDSKDKKKPIYKKPAFIITACIVGVVLIVAVIIIWLIVRQYVSTDDAYIDGHVVQVSSQVGARVENLRVVDNQLVHRGDLLIELDPTDYQVALLQAKAQVAAAEGKLQQAKAQVETAKASVPQAVAQEEAAQASLANTTKDLERYEKVDERARSRQQLDTAATTQTNAAAQVQEAHAQVVSAKANVVTAEAAVKAAAGDVQVADAGVKKAEVNLSYCEIAAPCDGRVTERTVEAGNYVTTGQALFLLVDPNVWVTANYKETQLAHMRPGQPVTIKVDAFPDLKFHGKVDSIQAGSGARFSVLPAENATGNYVKIVQRVPVKIVFEHNDNTNDAQLLSPGLSVVPRVKIR